ncbi:MAG: hypothetical protein AAB352_01125 [Patescibacteria group bacterium]
MDFLGGFEMMDAKLLVNAMIARSGGKKAGKRAKAERIAAKKAAEEAVRKAAEEAKAVAKPVVIFMRLHVPMGYRPKRDSCQKAVALRSN